MSLLFSRRVLPILLAVLGIAADLTAQRFSFKYFCGSCQADLEMKVMRRHPRPRGLPAPLFVQRVVRLQGMPCQEARPGESCPCLPNANAGCVLELEWSYVKKQVTDIFGDLVPKEFYLVHDRCEGRRLGSGCPGRRVSTGYEWEPSTGYLWEGDLFGAYCCNSLNKAKFMVTVNNYLSSLIEIHVRCSSCEPKAVEDPRGWPR